VLTVVVTVLVVILATANPPDHSSPEPSPGSQMPPTQDGESRADSDDAPKSAANPPQSRPRLVVRDSTLLPSPADPTPQGDTQQREHAA
jgi:hypothetical protein